MAVIEYCWGGQLKGTSDPCKKMKERKGKPARSWGEGRAELAEAKRKGDPSGGGILASGPMKFMPEFHGEELELSLSNTAKAS